LNVRRPSGSVEPKNVGAGMRTTLSSPKRSAHTGLEAECSTILYSSHYGWVDLDEGLRGSRSLQDASEIVHARQEGFLTFISTYLTSSIDPFLTCSSKGVEPSASRTLRNPDSQARLARSSGVTSCEGMAAPMDHSFKGSWMEIPVAFPFEAFVPETKPDGLVASGSSCWKGNGGMSRRGS